MQNKCKVCALARNCLGALYFFYTRTPWACTESGTRDFFLAPGGWVGRGVPPPPPLERLERLVNGESRKPHDWTDRFCSATVTAFAPKSGSFGAAGFLSPVPSVPVLLGATPGLLAAVSAAAAGAATVAAASVTVASTADVAATVPAAAAPAAATAVVAAAAAAAAAAAVAAAACAAAASAAAAACRRCCCPRCRGGRHCCCCCCCCHCCYCCCLLLSWLRVACGPPLLLSLLLLPLPQLLPLPARPGQRPDQPDRLASPASPTSRAARSGRPGGDGRWRRYICPGANWPSSPPSSVENTACILPQGSQDTGARGRGADDRRYGSQDKPTPCPRHPSQNMPVARATPRALNEREGGPLLYPAPPTPRAFQRDALDSPGLPARAGLWRKQRQHPWQNSQKCTSWCQPTRAPRARGRRRGAGAPPFDRPELGGARARARARARV
eukprot:gene22990-biopygen7247